MTYLCVWLIFWRRPAIKLNYFRGLCEKTTQMCTYFKTETDVSNQNLIDDFFFKFERPFHRKVIKWKKNGVTKLLSQKTETLYAEPNKSVEAATNSYSAAGTFLQ